MPAITIDKIYFSPAVAIARLGSSPVALEAFTWIEDPSSFGAGRTVIVPQVSFHVLPDGSIEPYLPGSLQFKDAGMIRPVCPFFELHASWKKSGGESRGSALTPALLKDAGLELHDLSFKVIAANRKAFRRTGDEACIFEARGLYPATDYRPQKLLAFTRSTSGNPLVFPDKPVPLGSFQIIRPGLPGEKGRASLDTIRVRFTPAKGEVYGPPFAVEGQTTNSRSPHEIVPPQNRILNPDSSWTKFQFKLPGPCVPPDIYDGESDLNRPTSWGVVDDTCDVIVTAKLASGVLPATARVIVGPPHYAPDRRTFYSLADELADRDPGSVPSVENSDPQQLPASVVDFFRRALETASLINVERQRNRAVFTNMENILGPKHRQPNPAFPAFDEKTMTAQDNVDGKMFLSNFGEKALESRSGDESDVKPVLAKSELACEQHQELATAEYLMSFMLEREDRFRDIIRPPFACLSELPERPQEHGLRGLRDPRIVRDRVHDMRMPPYMRDSDYSPLSITRRQWNQMEELQKILNRGRSHEKGALPHLSGVAKRIKAYHERKKKEQ